MSRAAAKQGTDLQDIAWLILDEQTRPAALAQLGKCDSPAAADIALHVDLWLVDRRQALRWIHEAGGTDPTFDDGPAEVSSPGSPRTATPGAAPKRRYVAGRNPAR